MRFLLFVGSIIIVNPLCSQNKVDLISGHWNDSGHKFEFVLCKDTADVFIGIITKTTDMGRSYGIEVGDTLFAVKQINNNSFYGKERNFQQGKPKWWAETRGSVKNRWLTTKSEGHSFGYRKIDGNTCEELPRGKQLDTPLAVNNSMEKELKEKGKVTLKGINFESGSAVITEQSFRTLDKLGGVLGSNPELRIRIEGHTDSIGSAQSNRDLSQLRADAVKKYLEQNHGISSSRLSASGKGESTPVQDNGTKQGRAANRRVEIHRVE